MLANVKVKTIYEFYISSDNKRKRDPTNCDVDVDDNSCVIIEDPYNKPSISNKHAHAAIVNRPTVIQYAPKIHAEPSNSS